MGSVASCAGLDFEKLLPAKTRRCASRGLDPFRAWQGWLAPRIVKCDVLP